MADKDIEIVHEMTKRRDANRMDMEAYGELGQAYFRLGEFEAADKALEEGTRIVEEYLKSLKRWKRKCETHLGDGKTVEVKAEVAAPVAKEEPRGGSGGKTVPDVRVDWFQTPNTVTVNLFIHSSQQIKGSTDHAKVTISDYSVYASVTLKSGEVFSWYADPLCSAIDVAASTYTIKHMKVEIVLVKKVPGIPWDGLTAENKKVLPTEPGAYPTSNVKRKDWTKETIDVEEEDKPEGNDALNKLFQDIYSRGDEATRKAMNKSFQESNGTVLSTNWKEVGSKKVEGQPPAGMEAKKWSE
eukprot:TRINITY_DN22099_c0_g1_i1.p1 TRINITY_DN22099_c0_g1~~TRINITY_DN22099_c0_g1_i1.p1  ORF type:complete len:339 (+),score=70.29 TRINITY_DN22099_c0_g1_i1:123-1019(+)